MKITFDNATTELLSKVMQGTDEKYRFSAAFEVRPVMIAGTTPPESSLLVGVDYTTTPTSIIGEEGVQIEVFPMDGPEITSIDPFRFEPNGIVTLRGSSLAKPGLSVRVGAAECPVVAQSEEWLRFRANGLIQTGTVISAGSQPISVLQTLPNGKARSSGLLVGRLLPVLTSITPPAGGFTLSGGPGTPVFGYIDLQGFLLGLEDDDVYVALTRNGVAVRLFDTFVRPAAPVPPNPVILQQQMQLQIPSTAPMEQGRYRLILRVNGSQAKNSPEIDIVG
jgi:hypothetical protein